MFGKDTLIPIIIIDYFYNINKINTKKPISLKSLIGFLVFLIS